MVKLDIMLHFLKKKVIKIRMTGYFFIFFFKSNLHRLFK